MSSLVLFPGRDSCDVNVEFQLPQHLHPPELNVLVPSHGSATVPLAASFLQSGGFFCQNRKIVIDELYKYMRNLHKSPRNNLCCLSVFKLMGYNARY